MDKLRNEEEKLANEISYVAGPGVTPGTWVDVMYLV